jgi:hypothetical protein
VCGASLSSEPESLPLQLLLPFAEMPRRKAGAEVGDDSAEEALPSWLQDVPAPTATEMPRDVWAGASEAKEPGPPGPNDKGMADRRPEEVLLAAGALSLSAQGPHLAGEMREDQQAGSAAAETEAESAQLVTGAAKARLFAEIVAPPRTSDRGEPMTGRGKPRAHPSSVRILYALLLAAVALPLLAGRYAPAWLRDQMPGVFYQQGREVRLSPAAVALYSAIDSLEPSAKVLVAFDYDPSAIGEMEPVARAIVQHLMDRRARIVAVSLLPSGGAIAQRLLDDLAAQRPEYSAGYGKDYVNMGYVPGQAAAVRLLGPSLVQAMPVDFPGNRSATLPIMGEIGGLSSLDLIVELTAAQDSLRWWIEQAGAEYGVPLGVGVSAALEPLALPYYEADHRQLAGLVGGVSGAAAYERLLVSAYADAGQEERLASLAAAETSLASSPGSAVLVSRLAPGLDAQALGALVLVVAVLIGNGLYLMRRAAGKER